MFTVVTAENIYKGSLHNYSTLSSKHTEVLIISHLFRKIFNPSNNVEIPASFVNFTFSHMKKYLLRVSPWYNG